MELITIRMDLHLATKAGEASKCELKTLTKPNAKPLSEEAKRIRGELFLAIGHAIAETMGEPEAVDAAIEA